MPECLRLSGGHCGKSNKKVIILGTDPFFDPFVKKVIILGTDPFVTPLLGGGRHTSFPGSHFIPRIYKLFYVRRIN